MIITAVIGAIIGAIIGGISGFIATKAIKDKKKAHKTASFIMVICLSAAFPIVNTPKIQNWIMMKFDSDYAKIQQYDDQMFALISTEQFRKEARNLDKQSVQKFILKGLMRVDQHKLNLWNKVRITMASENDELCAGLWSGKMGDVNFAKIIINLPEEDRRSWLVFTAAAIESELSETKDVALSETDIQLALKAFIDELSLEDRGRAQSVFAAGIAAPEKDGCWLMKELMTFSEGNSKESSTMLRYLAWAGSRAASNQQ